MYRLWSILAAVFISNLYFAAPECCPFLVSLQEESTNPRLEERLTNVLYEILTGGSCPDDNQMDPLKIDQVPGLFATLEYNSTDHVYTGFSKTNITSLRVSDDNQMVAIKMDVPSFVLQGQTNFTGYILYLPSNGTGPFELDYGRYILKVYVQLVQLSSGCCGCKYLQFGNFSLNAQSLSPTEFKISNITDDGVDVTEERNCFMDQYWEDLMYFIQDPVLQPVVQSLFTFANQYLIRSPMNDVLGN